MIDNELVGAVYIDIFLITWSWDIDLIINTRIQFIFFINCCVLSMINSVVLHIYRYIFDYMVMGHTVEK